jgi:hypothetical protein
LDHAVEGRVGLQEALQPVPDGVDMQAVSLPDLLIEQVFELFAGGERYQGQRILGPDFMNQEIEVLLGKGMHQGRRLGVRQYFVERFFRWHRQQSRPGFHECPLALLMDLRGR